MSIRVIYKLSNCKPIRTCGNILDSSLLWYCLTGIQPLAGSFGLEKTADFLFWIPSCSDMSIKLMVPEIWIKLPMKNEGIWSKCTRDKIPINTWKTKQWNNAFIVVLHLEVTMMPSTMKSFSYLIVNSRRPLAPA